MAYVDPIKVVRAFLASDSEIYSLTKRTVADGTERPMVFGTAIDRDLVPEEVMPVHCVRVSASGGSGSRGYLPETRQRVDVTCYGPTDLEAMRLFQAVAEAFDNCGRSIRGGGLIQSAWRVSDPIARREPGTRWPIAFGVWMVVVATPPVEAGLTA